MELAGINPLYLIAGLALLGLAPFLLMMVTSYVKIVVVTSLVRNALGVQQVVDRLQVGVHGQADIGHDVFPGDGRCVVSPEMFHRADLDAEHDVADALPSS